MEYRNGFLQPLPRPDPNRLCARRGKSYQFIAPSLEVWRLGAEGGDIIIENDPGLLAANPQMSDGLYAAGYAVFPHGHDLAAPGEEATAAGVAIILEYERCS